MTKIYEPKGRAREYSPLALNLYHGCTHGCKYCYVPKMFKRFNSEYQHNECYSTLDLGTLEASARKTPAGSQILLSFTGDPYSDVDTTATTEALKILRKYGHHVAVLSKGGKRMLRDIDLFMSFGDKIKVGATLSVKDENCKEWEPFAASASERIEVLRQLSKKGIKTWVSFEPVIYTEDALELLDEVKFVDHIKVGKLNGYAIDRPQDWSKFTYDFVEKCRGYGIKLYVKDSLQKYVDNLFLRQEEIDKDFLNV